GVETMLPLLLAEVRAAGLTLERVRDLVAANPAERFGLPEKGRVEVGYDADLTLVDLDDAEPIRADSLHTKCDWTPFEGREAVFPELTIVDGEIVYDGRAGDRFTVGLGRNVRE
ncbi:amidohydrolase family protein, partial [Halolamina salina]